MDNPQFLKTHAGYEWISFNRSSGNIAVARKFVKAMEEFEKGSSSLKDDEMEM